MSPLVPLVNRPAFSTRRAVAPARASALARALRRPVGPAISNAPCGPFPLFPHDDSLYCTPSLAALLAFFLVAATAIVSLSVRIDR